MTTVEVAPQGPKPLIRLRPAPRYEPPFDDEREYEPFPSAHQLALVWPAPAWPETATADTEASGAPQDEPTGTKDALAPAETALRETSRGETTLGDTGLDFTADTTVAAGPVTTAGTTAGAAGGAGDARLAVRRFVNACVEVLNGYRPAAHLRGLALPAEAARVVAQAIAGAHRVAELRRRDLRRPAQRARRRAAPVAVLRVRACEPRAGAVEASVVLVTGERTWALALRLELHHDSWVATTLRLI